MEEMEQRKKREGMCLHQHLLELFQGSTMQEGMKATFGDSESGCRDAHTNDRGWDVFYNFYGKRDKSIPVSNPWRLNLGKLVVPNVFVEPMLIRELAKNYHHQSMTVKTTTDHDLVDVSKEVAIECFDLDRSALRRINKDRFKKEYYAKRDFFKQKILPLFLRKLYKGGKRYLEMEMKPLDLTLFEDYFTKTYYALCQVLGEDCGLTFMSVDYMMMAIRIQHTDYNELYDFAEII